VATPRSREDEGERKGTSAGKFTSGEARTVAKLHLAVADHKRLDVGSLAMGKLQRAWKTATRGSGGGAEMMRARQEGSGHG
jgi:hypothetical protein